MIFSRGFYLQGIFFMRVNLHNSGSFCRNWGHHLEDRCKKGHFFTTKKLKRAPLVSPPPPMEPLYTFFWEKFFLKKISHNQGQHLDVRLSFNLKQPLQLAIYHTFSHSAGQETYKTGSYISFFWGIELSKIQSQGIYESNNHSSRVY